jgi:hypothetical protein
MYFTAKQVASPAQGRPKAGSVPAGDRSRRTANEGQS